MIPLRPSLTHFSAARSPTAGPFSGLPFSAAAHQNDHRFSLNPTQAWCASSGSFSQSHLFGEVESLTNQLTHPPLLASAAVHPDMAVGGLAFCIVVAGIFDFWSRLRSAPSETADDIAKRLNDLNKNLADKKNLRTRLKKPSPALEARIPEIETEIEQLKARLQQTGSFAAELEELEKDLAAKNDLRTRLKKPSPALEAKIPRIEAEIQRLKAAKPALPPSPVAAPAVVKLPPTKKTEWSDELKGLKPGQTVMIAGGAVQLEWDNGRFLIRITDGPQKPETALISRGKPLLNRLLDALKVSQRFQPYDGLSATEPAVLEAEDRLTLDGKSYRFFLENGEPRFEAVDFQPETAKTKGPLPRLETVPVKEARLTEGALEWVQTSGLDPKKILEKASAGGVRLIDAQGVRDALSIDLPLTAKNPGTVYLTPDPLGGFKAVNDYDPNEPHPVEIGIRTDRQYLIRSNDSLEESERPHLIRGKTDHVLTGEGFSDFFPPTILPTGEVMAGDAVTIGKLSFRFAYREHSARLECLEGPPSAFPVSGKLKFAPIPKDGFSRPLGVWTERGKKYKEKWEPQSSVPDFIVQKFWEGTDSNYAQRLIGPEDAETLFEALSFDLPDLLEAPVTLEVGGNAANGGIKIPQRKDDYGVPALLTPSKEAGYLLAAHPKVTFDPLVLRGDEAFKAPTEGKVKLKDGDVVVFAGYWTMAFAGKFFADVVYRFAQPQEGDRGRLVFLGTRQTTSPKVAADFPPEGRLHEVVDAQDGKTKFVVEEERRRIEEENERLHEKLVRDAGWVPMDVSRKNPGRVHIGNPKEPEAELAVTDDGKRWIRGTDWPQKERTYLIRNQKWYGVPADGYVELLAYDMIVLGGVSSQLLEDPRHKDRLWLRPVGQTKIPKTFLQIEKVLVELPNGQTRRFTESAEEMILSEGIDPELLFPQLEHLKGRLITAEDINEVRIHHFLGSAAQDPALRRQCEVALAVYGSLSKEARDRFWASPDRRGTGIPASFWKVYDALNDLVPRATTKALVAWLTHRLEAASRFTAEAQDWVLGQGHPFEAVLKKLEEGGREKGGRKDVFGLADIHDHFRSQLPDKARKMIDDERIVGVDPLERDFYLGQMVTVERIQALRVEHLVKTHGMEKRSAEGLVLTYSALPVETLDLLWERETGDPLWPRDLLPPKIFINLYEKMKMWKTGAGEEEILEQIQAAARFDDKAQDLIFHEGLDFRQALADLGAIAKEGLFGKTEPLWYDRSDIKLFRQRLLVEHGFAVEREREAFVEIWETFSQIERDRYWEEDVINGLPRRTGLYFPESFLKKLETLERPTKMFMDHGDVVQHFLDALSQDQDRPTTAMGEEVVEEEVIDLEPHEVQSFPPSEPLEDQRVTLVAPEPAPLNTQQRDLRHAIGKYQALADVAPSAPALQGALEDVKRKFEAMEPGWESLGDLPRKAEKLEAALAKLHPRNDLVLRYRIERAIEAINRRLQGLRPDLSSKCAVDAVTYVKLADEIRVKDGLFEEKVVEELKGKLARAHEALEAIPLPSPDSPPFRLTRKIILDQEGNSWIEVESEFDPDLKRLPLGYGVFSLDEVNRMINFYGKQEGEIAKNNLAKWETAKKRLEEEIE